MTKPFTIGDSISRRAIAHRVNDLISKENTQKFSFKPNQRIDGSLYAWGYNEEVFDINIFEPVAIRGQKLTQGEYHKQKILICGIATPRDNLEAFAVAQEKITAGQCGLIIISGLTWVRYDGGAGNFAALESAQSRLTAGDSGVAQILATTTNETLAAYLALIRFPSGSSGDASALWDNHYHDAFLIRAAD